VPSRLAFGWEEFPHRSSGSFMLQWKNNFPSFDSPGCADHIATFTMTFGIQLSLASYPCFLGSHYTMSRYSIQAKLGKSWSCCTSVLLFVDPNTKWPLNVRIWMTWVFPFVLKNPDVDIQPHLHRSTLSVASLCWLTTHHSHLHHHAEILTRTMCSLLHPFWLRQKILQANLRRY
jgi:hypothetical protein